MQQLLIGAIDIVGLLDLRLDNIMEFPLFELKQTEVETPACFNFQVMPTW